MIIRSAVLEDAAGIAKVHVSSWQTTYTGLMPDEVIASRGLENRTRIWTRILSDDNRKAILLVAEDNECIVGFVDGGTPQNDSEEFDSELYAIYLIKEAQGKGIGRALIQSFVKKLHEAGYTSMVLSVLNENVSSRGFYEKMGGTLSGEGEYRVTESVTLKTIQYGWKDIRRFLAES